MTHVAWQSIHSLVAEKTRFALIDKTTYDRAQLTALHKP